MAGIESSESPDGAMLFIFVFWFFLVWGTLDGAEELLLALQSGTIPGGTPRLEGHTVRCWGLEPRSDAWNASATPPHTSYHLLALFCLG